MLADDLERIRVQAMAEIAVAASEPLEALRVSLLGKNGALTALLKQLGAMAPEARRARGAELNQLKDTLGDALAARRAVLDEAALTARLAAERIDVTAPPRPEPAGGIHPISRSMEEIAAIF